MSTDIVADVLNQIMNAKKAKRQEIEVTRVSKLLIKVLDLMKQYGYVDYELLDKKLKITIKKINECRAIKPRYTVSKDSLDRYVRRFLPSRNFGFIVVSTNKGLMVHQETQENKIGGCLIAYFY